MKKLFYLALTASGLLLASCVNERLKVREETNHDPHHITQQQALKTMYSTIAELYTSSRAGTFVANIQTLKGKHLQKHQGSTRSEGNETLPEDLLYIVNFGDNDGFAILAADDRIPPVIAITDGGSLAIEDFLFEPIDSLTSMTPSQFVAQIVKQSFDIDTGESTPTTDIYGSPIVSPTPQVMSVAPLLQTQWNQGYPYNAMCPIKSGAGTGYNGRAPAGCISIAIAQVLAFHKKPALNTHAWLTEEETAQLFFGVSINTLVSQSLIDSNWNTLKNYPFNKWWKTTNYTPNSQDTVMYRYIARIVRSIGDGVNMRYNAEGSWTYPWNIDDFLLDLGYNGNTDFYWGFDAADVVNNVRAQRPVIISAGDGFSGHTWIIDGFQWYSYATGSCWLFHCNWGWGGKADGYYSRNLFHPVLGPLNPETGERDTLNTGSGIYTWLFSTVKIKP